MLKVSQPALQYMKKRNILVASFSGLTPITRAAGGPLDSLLPKIAERLSATRRGPVTPTQVLQVWLRKKGIPCVTYVDHARWEIRLCLTISFISQNHG